MESQQSKPVFVDFTNPHTDVLFPEGANREGCVFSMHTPERPLLMVPSKRGDQTQRECESVCVLDEPTRCEDYIATRVPQGF